MGVRQKGTIFSTGGADCSSLSAAVIAVHNRYLKNRYEEVFCYAQMDNPPVCLDPLPGLHPDGPSSAPGGTGRQGPDV